MITSSAAETYGGKQVTLYVLENEYIKVGITDFGAIIRFLRVKTAAGEVDVVMGAESVADYIKADCYCGGTIGRVANRIGGAAFVLDGKRYKVDANDGKNSLHGGKIGFDKRFFDVNISGDRLVCSLTSADGECGYPGRLETSVTYRLDGGALCIDYEAKCDKDTYWAPTNHAYFTLGAMSARDVMLTIYADAYTPVKAGLIPTGEVKSVDGTPFDFRSGKLIGRDIDMPDEQLKIVGGGYDHNFALSGEHAATAVYDGTGIRLDVYTDMPGLQLYSGNFISGLKAQGREFGRHSAFCLEAQYFPDAVNSDKFTKPLLAAGEVARRRIKYAFSTAKK